MKVSKQKIAKGDNEKKIFKEKYGENVIEIHYVETSIVLMMGRC